MRVGLICERKIDFPFEDMDPRDLDSELISEAEEDELVSGLQDAGHEVLRIGGAGDLLRHLGRWRNACQLFFNRSTGYRGDERSLMAPAVLEAAGLPYVGSTPYVHGLVRNKHHTKLVVHAAGIATPPAAVVRLGEEPPLTGISFPAIVKPLWESCSIGIERGKSVVADRAAALARAHEIAHRYRQPALVETFVRGLEVEVPVIIDPRPRALGALAITLHDRPVTGDDYLAADTVYGDNYGFAALPPHLDLDRVLDAAVRAASALGLRDYGRVDFRIAEDGTPWLLEANSHPHIQRHSSFFTLAHQQGLEYHEMLNELIRIATTRDQPPRSGGAP